MCRARTAAVCANGSINHHYSTEPPHTAACGMIVLYCIVLYLYIYIALLPMHTNQKRFQCERHREKRAVLRERKEEFGSPANKVNLVEQRFPNFLGCGPLLL